MTTFLTKVSDSVQELRTVRSMTTLALLMAMALVLNPFVSIQITPTLKLGFGFLATAAMGMLYGPFWAGVAAGLVDIFQFVLKPTGQFFPGFTITAMLGGVFYGFFLYKNKTSLPRIILVKTLINVLLHLLLNSYWLTILYDQAFWAQIPARIVKNVAMLPIEILLLKALLPQLVKITQLIQRSHANESK